MNKLQLSLACIASIAINSADALADTSILVHGVSKHVNSPACMLYGSDFKQCQYNELNYGLGVIERNTGDKWYYMSGAYKNSFGRLSTYIGGGYQISKYSGIKGAFITGYPQLKVVPMVAPYLTIPTFIDKFTISLDIPFMPGTTQALTMSIQYKL